MSTRRSTSAFIFLVTTAVVFFAVFADAARLRALHSPTIALKRDLVGRLQLTDLCLFTEARYTRHPSQADLFSAFMDHPFAFEHFPSGSLIPPPPTLLDAHETLAR